MSIDILRKVIRQVMTQGPSQVSFGWQGGEPTLMGLPFFEQAVSFQQQFGHNQSVGNGLQTNGLLIDNNWVEFFKAYNFLIGLSLDGPEHIHDHYRKNRSGKGSWQKVVDSARLLLESGVAVNSLTVVNNYSVKYPEEIYSYLKQLGFVYMQFIPCIEPHPILPDTNAPFSLTPEQYGKFLCTLFDLWQADCKDGMPTTSIRHFDSLVQSYLEQGAPECTMKAKCGDYLVIEHNGDVFSCDFFVQPSHHLGNVQDQSLIEMLNSPQQEQFGSQKSVLVAECTSCPWLTHCYGGCLKDRLYNTQGQHITAFCHSYKQFFEHADSRLKKLAAKLASHSLQQEDVQPITETVSQRDISRNQPCPCGSGLKYKRCCGKIS